MSEIKKFVKRASLFLGQDDLPKNSSTYTLRDVRVNGFGPAKACITMYHIDRGLTSALLSFMSSQNPSAPVDGDTVILMQTSGATGLVLSAVSRRWILLCYDMQLLPAGKLFGPTHHISLYLPSWSATCKYSYANMVAYMAYYVVAPVLQRHSGTSTTQFLDPLLSSKRRAEQILDILQSYGKHIESSEQCATEWKGKTRFLPQIQRRIDFNETIQMILPSFPWKSINTTTKVLGQNPDLGEVLALSRLHQLCEDIRAIYTPGAEIHIATDGLVFDGDLSFQANFSSIPYLGVDVVGIPDENTWTYSEELSRIILERGFRNVKLRRVTDMMGLVEGEQMTRNLYLSRCDASRKRLLREYGRTEQEVRRMIESDSDTLLTYRGFIRFLEADLRYSEIAKQARSGTQYRRKVKKVAIEMMIRAESFTRFIQVNYPEFVRLSIHPSSGATKLSVPLIIQADGVFPRTPWHSCVAVGINGSLRTCLSQDVSKTHRLIYRQGRPYYYREKSDLWDWDEDLVEVEPLYPRGLLVTPSKDSTKGSLMLNERYVEKLHMLERSFGGSVRAIGFLNHGKSFIHG